MKVELRPGNEVKKAHPQFVPPYAMYKLITVAPKPTFAL